MCVNDLGQFSLIHRFGAPGNRTPLKIIKVWEYILPPDYFLAFISYFLKTPATKFQTAVSPKKLNHQPVAGVINPNMITCSITPAIM